MLRILILCLVSSSTVNSYYIRIESPSAKSEQRFLLTPPQRAEPYQIHPQQVVPLYRFEYPEKHVYYYSPQTVHSPAGLHTLNYDHFNRIVNAQPISHQQEPQYQYHHQHYQQHQLKDQQQQYQSQQYMPQQQMQQHQLEDQQQEHQYMQMQPQQQMQQHQLEDHQQQQNEPKMQQQQEQQQLNDVSNEAVIIEHSDSPFQLNDRYYVMNNKDNPPVFYGDIDPQTGHPTSNIFSLQQLQPVEPIVSNEDEYKKLIDVQKEDESTTTLSPPADFSETTPSSAEFERKTAKIIIVEGEKDREADFTNIPTTISPATDSAETASTSAESESRIAVRINVEEEKDEEAAASTTMSTITTKITELTDSTETAFTSAESESTTKMRIIVEDERDEEETAASTTMQTKTTTESRADDEVDDLITKEIALREIEQTEKNSNSSRQGSDESIASAKPSALALAGAGGVASSKPRATAVTGNYGLSVASPQATAVAGDYGEFLSGDDDLKDMKKVNRIISTTKIINEYRKNIF